MAADGVGATEWLEMGGEKKPLVMSDLGCADGCGRQMGAENCADGCGRRGCKGVAGNGWREEAAGDERLWLRGDGCGRQTAMGAENCVDGCGRRGCNGVAGNGWGEEAGARESLWKWVVGNGGEKKPLVMSELGCADGCGRQMGWENCADGCGRRGFQVVVGMGIWRRSRWRSASLAERTAAGGKWVRRIARTAADGCRRRGCNGVVGNGWKEEAVGDVRA